jgi:pimeloyl-ACP methyl ester carboxylesterase
MTTVALVHGAFHGAWCFDRLLPELRSRGLDPLAIDLPKEDPAAGNVRNAEVILDALAGRDDVILVGHSLAGLTVPLVAAQRPLRRLVYLCSLIPQPGLSGFDWIPDAGVPCFDWSAYQLDHGDGTASWDVARGAGMFVSSCDAETAAWAASQLGRQAWLPSTEPCPLAALPDGPSAYIACALDQVISPDWQLRAPREQLGVEPIVLQADHSPFLSAPAQLADTLAALV